MTEEQAEAIRRRLRKLKGPEDFASIAADRYNDPPNFGYEFDLLSHIVRSAGDIFKAENTVIRNLELGPETEVRFTTVSFKRNDISIEDAAPRRRKLFYYQRSPQSSLCVTKINRSATPPYSRQDWIAKRKAAISDAVVHCKANIVVLGEFDFPPEEDWSQAQEIEAYKKDIENFKDTIDETINQQTRKVMVLAGTRHESRYDTTNQAVFCANTGYLFSNREARIENDKRLIKVFKKSPAKKMGETLSSIRGISLETFETYIGRVAVLICSDAYDPNIIFEMFMKSIDRGTDRVEFFLVPSYNPSDKLVWSCQALSYFANAAVIYCNTHNYRGAFGSSQFFLCGDRLADWHGRGFLSKFVPPVIEEGPPRDDYELTTYTVDLDLIREVVTHAQERRSPEVKELLGGSERPSSPR